MLLLWCFPEKVVEDDDYDPDRELPAKKRKKNYRSPAFSQEREWEKFAAKNFIQHNDYQKQINDINSGTCRNRPTYTYTQVLQRIIIFFMPLHR